MASDESLLEEQVKRKSGRKLQRKTADIEDLTSAGHRALQEGRPQDALSCFKQALKIATQVRWNMRQVRLLYLEHLLAKFLE